MEFDANEEPVAEELLEVLEELEVHAKTTVRKGHVVVYIKGYEEIAAVLGAVGAGSAAMEIFNISIEREIRNGIILPRMAPVALCLVQRQEKRWI